MNKSNELAKNTIIIFLGKFCTQFISFLLIPIYTKFLLVKDYGYVDLIQTYISLAVPIIILRLDSAIFRFLIDERKINENKEKTISSVFFILFIQILIFSILFIIIDIIYNFTYFVEIALNVIFMSISNVLLQLCRGIGDNVGYSIASIICATAIILSNIIMIVILHQNASAILICQAIGNIICTLYLFFRNKIYTFFKLKSISKKNIHSLLKYSIPMIPDGLSWWIINASDRTIISLIIGSSFNGIYAISTKFSNILSNMFQIFNMTWQESASLHINENDKDEFFSHIFNITLKLFSCICLFIMVCMPFIYRIAIGNEYTRSYIYIPILLLGNVFYSIANIVGAVYIAKKDTKKVAKTTMMAAIINILINILFIKKLGLFAAAISTLIAYFILSIYRIFDCRKYVKFNIDWLFIVIISAFGILCSLIYYKKNLIFDVINLLFVTIFSVFINKKIIKNLFKIIKHKLKF